jgi:hypothetical protein
MFSIAAIFSLASLSQAPSTGVSRSEQIRVSARIMRGVTGSERLQNAHPKDRTRVIVEKLADGRESRLIILDYE